MLLPAASKPTLATPLPLSGRSSDCETLHIPPLVPDGTIRIPDEGRWSDLTSVCSRHCSGVALEQKLKTNWSGWENAIIRARVDVAQRRHDSMINIAIDLNLGL